MLRLWLGLDRVRVSKRCFANETQVEDDDFEQALVITDLFTNDYG